jgi:hypothetical protein
MHCVCSGCYNKSTISCMTYKQLKFMVLEAGKSKIKTLTN